MTGKCQNITAFYPGILHSHFTLPDPVRVKRGLWFKKLVGRQFFETNCNTDFLLANLEKV